MFGWCCQVPELATIKTVETTVWSANGVRTRFGPLLDNTSPSCRWTCWPVWSGGRSWALESWYYFCVCWRACRFLWTAVSWGVWEESSGRLDLSCHKYRSSAEEGRLLSMGVVCRQQREVWISTALPCLEHGFLDGLDHAFGKSVGLGVSG